MDISQGNHRRRKVHDDFLLLLCKSLVYRETHFQIYCIFFWYIKMCRKLCSLIWGIWWFHRSKEFEALKTGKLAILPWLSCQYNKNRVVDLPSSMFLAQCCTVNIAIGWKFYKGTVLTRSQKKIRCYQNFCIALYYFNYLSKYPLYLFKLFRAGG